MSLSVSSSPNQSPLKFSSPDKISRLQSSPGQQDVLIPNSPEELISLFNKKEILISKLLEDNKSLSAFIQHNDLNKIHQEKERLQMESSHKDEEILKLKALLDSHLRGRLSPETSDFRVSVQKSPDTVYIEIPENSKFIEEVLEKQVKEFKSKIKEMAAEIEKEKRKSAELEAEVKKNAVEIQISRSNEEKIVMLTTELQRTTAIIQEMRNQLVFLQNENAVLKENERIYKENERNSVSLRLQLEEKIKNLCLELEKRDKERNNKVLDDEKNYKAAINNALKLLKEEEEKLNSLYDKLCLKEEKVKFLEEKIQMLKSKKEGGLNQVLEGQKSMVKSKFEDISRIYEEALNKMKEKDERIIVQEKIIEQIKKINNDNINFLKEKEAELVELRRHLGQSKDPREIESIIKAKAKLEEMFILVKSENERLFHELMVQQRALDQVKRIHAENLRDKEKRHAPPPNEDLGAFREKESEISALKQKIGGLTLDFEMAKKEKEAEILSLKQKIVSLNSEQNTLLKERENEIIALKQHSTDNQRFLLNMEIENLKKLIIDHFNGYLVVIRNNDPSAGLKPDSSLNELREKLNLIIKEFNRNLNDYTNSQIVFTETLKDKKEVEEQIVHKNKEIKEFEFKNQELLAKNLVLNAEIIRLSQCLKQIESDFYARSDERFREIESRLMLAHTEIENLKSNLKFRNQENESLKKSNEHLLRYSSFESELITLKQELEKSEMKYIEKMKENDVLKRKLNENEDILIEKTEKVKKAIADKENFRINELEIELKFVKQENEHLNKVKQEQMTQIGQMKTALLELENEKTTLKIDLAECKGRNQILEDEKEKFVNEYVLKANVESQMSQLRGKVDQLEHEKSLKEYENETLRGSLKGKEKFGEELEIFRERHSDLEKELVLMKKKYNENEEVRNEMHNDLNVLTDKVQLHESKSRQLTRDLQESIEESKRLHEELQRKTQEQTEQRRRFDSELNAKNEELEELKAMEKKFKEIFGKQALSVSEIERLHQIIKEKNEENKKFNIEVTELQKEMEKSREMLKNYQDLKSLIESVKGENEELNIMLFKNREEMKKIAEKTTKLEEENIILRDKNSEIEGYNRENLHKLLEYQKFLEKLEFENDKLKSLMFERLKEIENLKKKISEISNVYEVNANTAKERFEEIISFYLKEEENVISRSQPERNHKMRNPDQSKFNERTEKKTSKKRTKSNLFGKNDDDLQREDDDISSNINLYESMLKMMMFELANLSQFKDTRMSELKKMKLKIGKLKQNLEQNVFLLEERNLRLQDLLLQICNIEKKVEKAGLEEKM